jgi:hypothetical protein
MARRVRERNVHVSRSERHVGGVLAGPAVRVWHRLVGGCDARTGSMIERVPDPKPPLFVWEPGDLYVFDDVVSAQTWLEAADVKHGSDVAYDAVGRRLRLRVEGDPPTWWNRWWRREWVVIECTEDAPSGAGELREILERFLTAVGEKPTELALLSLPELEAIARLRSASIR